MQSQEEDFWADPGVLAAADVALAAADLHSPCSQRKRARLDLPVELWRKVFQAAGGVPRNFQLWWTQRARLAATIACVSRSARSAMLGPQAAELWEPLVFCSGLPGLPSAAYPGLSQQQACKMNAWLLRWAPVVQHARIVGGGWDLSELEAVVSSLGQLQGRLDLRHLHTPSEVACIGAALWGSDCPVACLHFHGSVPCFFPKSLVELEVHHTQGQAPPAVHGFTPLLASLPNLGRLQSLVLHSNEAALSAHGLACTSSCEALQRLHVSLMPFQVDPLGSFTMASPPWSVPHFSNNLGALQDVPGHVEVKLTLRMLSFSASAGQELFGLELAELEVWCLGACLMTEKLAQALLDNRATRHLTLRALDPALVWDWPPSGPRVLHEPLSQADVAPYAAELERRAELEEAAYQDEVEFDHNW